MDLISMWVAPQGRGQGVGDALLRHAIGWVAQRDPGAALRLQVREHNEHAVALYERHGFVTTGRCTQDPREITMRRG